MGTTWMRLLRRTQAKEAWDCDGVAHGLRPGSAKGMHNTLVPEPARVPTGDIGLSFALVCLQPPSRYNRSTCPKSYNLLKDSYVLFPLRSSCVCYFQGKRRLLTSFTFLLRPFSMAHDSDSSPSLNARAPNLPPATTKWVLSLSSPLLPESVESSDSSLSSSPSSVSSPPLPKLSSSSQWSAAL
jgi:hypothetical protein